MADEEINEEELVAEGLHIKTDDEDTAEPEELVDDPNIELFGKAFPKEDEETEESEEDSEAQEMYSIMYQEYEER